jgi:hypothetical protein
VIRLELEPRDIDLIFASLQSAALGVPYHVVSSLLAKIEEQGRPQLNKMAVIEEVAEVVQ